MSCCCIKSKFLGCFNSCNDCFETGIILDMVGVYTIKYSYNSTELNYEYPYESTGTTELILYNEFRDDQIVFIKIIRPDGLEFVVNELELNPNTNEYEQVTYDCFNFKVNIQINRDRDLNACNPDFPVPCSDIAVDHNFSFLTPIILDLPIETVSPDLTINFTHEPCSEKVYLESVYLVYNGNSIDYNDYFHFPMLSEYTDSFVFNVGAFEAQDGFIPGDFLTLTINFTNTFYTQTYTLLINII